MSTLSKATFLTDFTKPADQHRSQTHEAPSFIRLTAGQDIDQRRQWETAQNAQGANTEFPPAP